jgi:preprotein translocase subunit SecG
MITVVLVIHIMIAVALIGVILLQKSEGGALGMGGGGMSGFMTGRSTANLLTRVTGGLVAAFFATSIVLAYLASNTRGVVDPLLSPQPVQSKPATQAPAAPPPAEPAAPLAK